MKAKTATFDLTVNGTTISVIATPYQTATSEKRYRVSINGSPVHIFALNQNLQRFTDIDRGALSSEIPEPFEKAIGQELYSIAA